MTMDSVNTTIALVVASIIVVMVALTIQGVPTYPELCEVRAGANYTFVNDSGVLEDQTITCKGPNGTIKNVSAIVNSTS